MTQPAPKHLLRPEALERLEALFPGNGAAQLHRIEAFLAVAAARPGQQFIVPPDLDGPLHQVLAARIRPGQGLEAVPFEHVLIASNDQNYEDTVGRTWEELTSPLAELTRLAMEADGVTTDPSARYVDPACYVRFPVAQAA